MTSRLSSKCIAQGFTLVELVCTIAILLLLAAGVLKVSNTAQERGKFAQTKAEMLKISDLLETYRTFHGDYPYIEEHNDNQGDVLFAALHGKIDPFGNSLESASDLVEIQIREINDKFVDPFWNDYIYYYKTRSSPDTWEHPSYVLISKGAKRDKSTTVSTSGKVSKNSDGDIVLTSGGFL